MTSDTAGRVSGVTDAERIEGAMLAFAAGDALGVPWEGAPPERVDAVAVTALPDAGRGWPRGATSDDTAQMALVARCLAEAGGRPSTLGFLTRLAEAAPTMRGIGPTTRRAVEHFLTTGERLPASGPHRATNGAAMRMPPVGWTVPLADPGTRRTLAETLAVATHLAPEAVGAACVIAAMASWAMEGAATREIVDAAGAEAGWAAERLGPLGAVRDAAAGRWAPPVGGVSLDAAETVAAVVHVLRETPGLAAALPYAVSLGGDTDTVAALVGGVLGARDPSQVRRLEWLGLVSLDELPDIGELVARLEALRAAWEG
ncbi:ADP-ribosylglycohydrolase family protein [Microbispora sp. NPDC049125]|uniref:ADP-ribosylglycohydrolase family protein n=1 Tax=Microbispora sp. NPDC049125 TaxID=3154929 RepID=UPI003467DBA2